LRDLARLRAGPQIFSASNPRLNSSAKAGFWSEPSARSLRTTCRRNGGSVSRVSRRMITLDAYAGTEKTAAEIAAVALASMDANDFAARLDRAITRSGKLTEGKALERS